ncbi:MAG: FAD-dependent oxidoreductase, partial [Actinobacteria bacterium]|nr:FAD-dependent oxidoreductase [Actinomycetota bacterium]
NNFDFGVIGAGIVGLAMANRIRQIHPNATIAVFDKERSVGVHASGRNSGVLHAGFYYSPNSLKAALTRDGNKLLRDFCSEENIRVKETGKVVVAQDPSEVAALQELHRRGNANGVLTELVTPEQLAELEPLAKTSELALWSPNTAVANPLQVGETAAIELTITPARSTSWLTVWSTSVTGALNGDPNADNNTSTSKLYVNHKPRAEKASLTATAGGKPVKISLANKISDIDGDALTIELGRLQHGSAAVSGDVVTYKPPKNWTGKFTVSYDLSDGKGGSAKSSIVITVKPNKPVKPDNSNEFRPSCIRFGC